MTEVLLAGIVNVLAFAGLVLLIGKLVGQRWAQITAILADSAVFSEEQPVRLPLKRPVERPLRYAA
jgi:hypothetical protein